MRRRASGILLLLLAVVAALVMPQLLRPGTVGRPAAAPLPAPPAIGTCVDLVGSSHVVLACNQPHDAEVFAAWSADDPERPRGRANPRCDQELTRLLSPRLPSYSGWYLTVVNASAQLIRAPADQRVGRRGWSACLLRPAGLHRYSGVLAGDVDQRPGEFGECLRADAVIVVNCTDQHATERLAVAVGYSDFGTSEPLQAGELPADLILTLQRQCVQIARDLTRNTDPTFGGRVAVQVVGAGVTRMGEHDGNYRQYGASCVIRSAQPLVDSVVGIGDAALPLG